nr:c-type cytochrome [Legionella oakridgensis]
MMSVGTFIWAASHHPQDFLKEISGSKNEGEQIVHHFCSNCHDRKPLIALGAPRIGVETDWEPRVKQGLEVLFKHTDEGLNAMPARGGCFECSDQQLLKAILAMIPENEKEALLDTKKDHNKNN